ncbi:hypothetical protein ACH9L7_14605 [Haloferax sp. S1W]|uniref:hypothetical protein n=1 Tax=Haloferax sp. S1W TaxID=3377110 RepID=UPI0037CBE904
MTTETCSDDFQLLLSEDTDVEEVVLGFKKGGELHELVTIKPPIQVTMQHP